jgi:hypothetical protein
VFLRGKRMERETRPSFRTPFEWKRGFRDCDIAYAAMNCKCSFISKTESSKVCSGGIECRPRVPV